MTATFSPDGRYRYDLTRSTRSLTGYGTAVWIMLNPSTADAEHDDPTIRRVLGFSKRLDVADVAVVNLFAYRATSPGDLLSADDPIGPDNDATIERHVRSAYIVVAAWGSWWETQPISRRPSRLNVEQIVADCGRRLYCVGVTDSGTPRHPLYVPKRQPIVPFE